MMSYARPVDRAVRIKIDDVYMEADWSVPYGAEGIIVFVHGTGCSRFSRRQRKVARELYDQKFATLLVDLLTSDEEREDMLTASLRFNAALLADRVVAAVQWVKTDLETLGLPVGIFATGTGAGAALLAASRIPLGVDAIVCRGGRPDLAGPALNKVKAPTLLIVGDGDGETVAMNRWAYWRMDCERHIEIVKNAENSFDDPVHLAKASSLSAEWFDVHVASRFPGWSFSR